MGETHTHRHGGGAEGEYSAISYGELPWVQSLLAPGLGFTLGPNVDWLRHVMAVSDRHRVLCIGYRRHGCVFVVLRYAIYMFSLGYCSCLITGTEWCCS